VRPKAENGLRTHENSSGKPLLCADLSAKPINSCFQFHWLLVRIAFRELDQRFPKADFDISFSPLTSVLNRKHQQNSDRTQEAKLVRAHENLLDSVLNS
jgi:hypothetical protein